MPIVACMTQRSRSHALTASDAELAQRVYDAGGAPAEEAELCRRFAPRVRAYGARHLGDRESALDLAQHVLMVTITKLRQREIAEPSRIASFVLGAARMTAQNMRRAERRRRISEDSADSLADLAVDPPEPADSERLAECLAALAERERSVVVLTFYDMQTSRDVAAILGTSDGNVRVIRSRALGRLRDCMQLDREDER